METLNLRGRLQQGMVIPAHPLALDHERRLDERHQRALTRYYIDSGAGGIAVGVHTTQFKIHQPEVGLYKPVLELAAEEAGRRSPSLLKVAGLVGKTEQAVLEAEMAVDVGYDCGLLSLGALSAATDDTLIEHTREVADRIPVFGFYLQPSVGGRVLSHHFWRRFVEIENVVAIKIAPFNRYQTLDVVRALAESQRSCEIALYTGNDDNIILDLLTPFDFAGSAASTLRVVGGLLGQWAVWTHTAVRLLEEIRTLVGSDGPVPQRMLHLNTHLTDANSAVFDVAHQFQGCIPGIMEVLRRQGLVASRMCLDPHEQLSPGQAEELERVQRDYPHLTDDGFVQEHLDEWLR